jgi:hypothetical protein
MTDRRQDYVLYAVDPIESYRARQRTDSGNGVSSASTSTTRSADSKRLEGDAKGKGKSSAFVVGKGFFTWALAESGDGQSLVHGRIRDEYAEDDESDSSDGEDDGLEGKVLEVSLRLKAASSTSRDQFIDRVKVFETSAPKAEVAAGAIDDSPQEDIARGQMREETADVKPRISASSPVTAMEREQFQAPAPVTNTPAQQQLLQFLQALQAQAASASASNEPTVPSEQGAPQVTQLHKPWQQPVVAHTNSKVASGNSPDAMVHFLRSLNAPSPGANANSERSAFASGATSFASRGTSSLSAPRTSASALSKSPLPESAASPILGGLTPGYEAGYVSRPSPMTETKASVPIVKLDEAENGTNDALNDGLSHSDSARSQEPSRAKQCCYNCGVRSQRAWRHLVLADEDAVRFKEGSVLFDHGKKLHRSCNACGLYYNKYAGISRPEHVWKEAQRLKKEQHAKGGDKIHGKNCSCSTGEDKTHSSAEDGEALGQSSLLLARHKQIGRTLSEACERETTRRASVCGEYEESDQETVVGSLPPRRVDNFDEARLKDYVQDAEGQWRTKRSILENPENKRPGRPKGSKTGQGQGRPRERRLRSKRPVQGSGQEDRGDIPARGRGVMTASSPGAASMLMKSEKRESHAAESLLAQSSPMRSSSSAHHLAKTPGSAVNRARYGAPTYLLDSSPATAFQTVLNEAETDWHTLCGLSPRRSPRKHPHGTQSGLNPYATIATISPTGKSSKPTDTLSALDLMKMTSSSPLTRSRVKSGHFQLDDSWFSSEGLCFGEKQAAASSSLTSPGSPSPSPAHLKSRGMKRKSEQEVMLQPGQRTTQRASSTGRGLSQHDAPQSTERARKAARQARQATSVGGGQSNGTLDAGPFMGLDVAEAISGHEEDDEDEAGGGSPTLGRIRRMKDKSDRDSLSIHASPASGEGLLNFTEDWTRSNSMRELFPTPSPVKQQWNMNSPSNGLWHSPTSWAISTTTQVKVEEEQEKRGGQSNMALAELDSNQPQTQLIRRKPLPATVEDAPSSANSASSSPMEEDDSLEEGDELKGGNLMDLFEDPYGLLAASGIGVQGNQPGLSMEDFESIELFKGVDFSQQLDFFTQMGSNGIAAHLAPSQGDSSTLKIEGKGKARSEAVAIAPSSSNATTADFAALLKDPAMQAILAHMHLSPSKARLHQQQQQISLPYSQDGSVMASASTH